nr:MAG TPA: hypothetical protein [Caudoviricetes sp.]
MLFSALCNHGRPKPWSSSVQRNSNGITQALRVLWEYIRPRPKNGKVCRSDTRPRRVSEPRKTLRG